MGVCWNFLSPFVSVQAEGGAGRFFACSKLAEDLCVFLAGEIKKYFLVVFLKEGFLIEAHVSFDIDIDLCLYVSRQCKEDVSSLVSVTALSPALLQACYDFLSAPRGQSYY